MKRIFLLASTVIFLIFFPNNISYAATLTSISLSSTEIYLSTVTGSEREQEIAVTAKGVSGTSTASVFLSETQIIHGYHLDGR